MTCIKICGITNLPDACCAAQAGADLLGFIFYPPSPRYISLEQSAEIVRAMRAESACGRPRFVGVFVNEPAERVQAVMRAVGLDLIQLHGSETWEDVRRLHPYAFKALRPRTLDEALALVDTFRPAFLGDLQAPDLLVDAYHPERPGGTGIQADLTMARALAGRVRLLLAGGLTPENVGGVVRQVRPWGVDVSSGVEASQGKKDQARVRAFIEAVKGEP